MLVLLNSVTKTVSIPSNLLVLQKKSQTINTRLQLPSGLPWGTNHQHQTSASFWTAMGNLDSHWFLSCLNSFILLTFWLSLMR